MSWEQVNLADVSPNPEPIPEGAHTFILLPGTSEDETGRLVLSVAVTGDSEFSGRRTRMSYPNPDQEEWSARYVKRLELALGIDTENGENPVGYLNRVANATFIGDVIHNKRVNTETGETTTYANVRLASVRPA